MVSAISKPDAFAKCRQKEGCRGRSTWHQTPGIRSSRAGADSDGYTNFVLGDDWHVYTDVLGLGCHTRVGWRTQVLVLFIKTCLRRFNLSCFCRDDIALGDSVVLFHEGIVENANTAGRHPECSSDLY